VPGGEKMIYIIILIIAAVLLGVAIVGCSKPGKSENLCKYSKDDEDGKK
jgi:hypothetical protein